MKINIVKNGPYLISGNVPLSELVIVPGEKGNEYKKGRVFETEKEYALCRCGKSSTMPFCDGTHKKIPFDGTLTASHKSIKDQSVIYEGINIMLEDTEKLCAFSRFCHSTEGDVWNLTQDATSKNEEEEAIRLACECPSGRLVMTDKTNGKVIEPNFKPSIAILQDPQKDCSGPIWVRGGIPIVDDEGHQYEVRNRVTLCRCGKSYNKPFCDANHISSKFNDGSL